MESNGAPLSPISPPNGSNAAAASRRSFRKKAAPSPFPAAPPPEPQRHLQPSSSTPQTSGRTHVRLQRSASDMASTTSSRLTGGPHLQQQQQLHHRSKNNNNVNNNNNNNNSHQGDDVINKSQPTSEQFATSSLGRRRIPTPPSRDSPPALPPRRPFPRPGGAVAVAVGSSPSTTPVPDASTAFFPATQTILHSTTQTPSFQASSSIATHTHVVFSGHPTRTQIPASAASPSPSSPSATAASTTTPTTTTTATTTTPVVPPRPPPREMVSIDSPHRYRAKPNEYVDSPHLTETSTSASISPSTSSSSPSSRVTVASRIAPVKKCKTSYARQPRAARSTSQENLENASRDMKLRQSQTPTSDFIGGQHHRHLRHHHRHHNGSSQSTNGLSTRSSSTTHQQQQQQPTHDNVISTQPVISSGLKKPESSILSSATGGGPNSSASDSSFSSSSPPPVVSRVPLPGGGGGIVSQPPVDSVYCPNCHRCTCEKCVSPRNLPSDWICKKSCYCSPETALDYASCMCCVKGYFYHCAKDSDEDASCADDPCSCGPPRCLSRWACMGVISLFLPCILCYLPLKGCIDAVEVCYNCCHRRGCRCANDKGGGGGGGGGGKSAAGNARDSFNSTSLLQNSRSGTSSSIAGGGSGLVGRRGSLPNSISISSTTAILPLSGSRGVDGNPKTAESPDLRGKFLKTEAETY